LNCRECGTEFDHPVEVINPKESEEKDLLLSEQLSVASGALKCVAALSVDAAIELSDWLKKNGIPAEIKRFLHEGGLEYGDVLAEECNFDRACDLAEAWEMERRSEAESKSNRFCSRCGSRHLEYVANESFGTIWKCKDCGNDFAK